MSSITETLAQRRAQLETRKHQAKATSHASIEEAVSNTTTSSIEIPAAVDNLIDNKMYYNKFRKLIREGHLSDLLELAELAASKEKPSHWFAMVTAKRRWEQTLKFLTKAREIAAKVAEVAKRVKVPAQKLGVVYKACWSLKDLAIRNAALAADVVAEKGGDDFKLFTWLCWKNPKHQTVA